MAHQRYTFGFTGEDETSHREDRFSPQNEADYERLARIAAAEASVGASSGRSASAETSASASASSTPCSRRGLRGNTHVHCSDACSLDQPVTTDYVRPASAAQTNPAGDIETALRRLVESTAR